MPHATFVSQQHQAASFDVFKKPFFSFALNDMLTVEPSIVVMNRSQANNYILYNVNLQYLFIYIPLSLFFINNSNT